MCLLCLQGIYCGKYLLSDVMWNSINLFLFFSIEIAHVFLFPSEISKTSVCNCWRKSSLICVTRTGFFLLGFIREDEIPSERSQETFEQEIIFLLNLKVSSMVWREMLCFKMHLSSEPSTHTHKVMLVYTHTHPPSSLRAPCGLIITTDRLKHCFHIRRGTRAWMAWC